MVLYAMSEHITIWEERCKEPVNPSKKTHEDPDSSPHEGEKRERLTYLPGFRQGHSIRTMPLSDIPEGSSRGGGHRRYLGEKDCSIFLAGGEELSQQEMLQMIQDRNVHKEIASSSSGLLASGGEVMNVSETHVHRTDQILTLGSREVVTFYSRLDSVEALIDSIA